ncbi:MAG TPA: acyltransferase [Candidatus Saccharimonadales bacterium]|nr:acyltransferase [Candidatus Saccharimonadales bacterium]
MQKRNFGLDVLRASAILFVLFNHVLNYFITFHRSTIIGDISGILGVEIFFVLSGFLIGKILLTSFGEGSSHHAIKNFYIKRWFRTLPLYYFLLVIFIIIAAISTRKLDFYFLHFVFLQNFLPLKFFSISWSLAIEEWFYLLVPLLLFFSYKLQFFTKRTMTFLLLFIIAIISIRVAYISFFHPTFDDIRKNTFLRFDSLFIGVLLAGVKMHLPVIYKHLNKIIFPIIALFLMAIMAYWYIIYYVQIELNPPFFVTAFSLPILSILIATTIPFFEFSPFINTRVHRLVVLRETLIWVSLFSYSIYLTHVDIFDTVKGALPKLSPLIVMPIALSLTFLTAYLLYWYIEKPFMKMRNKFIK